MDNQVKANCKKCGLPKFEDEFHLNKVGGREYRKRVCKACDNLSRKCRTISTYKERCGVDPTHKNKASALARKARKDPSKRARFILEDTRKDDRSRGHLNDLSREWIEASIQDGCFYCGESELLMILDRIDNFKGHTKDNVHAACIRCNYLRRDMPYTVWLAIVPIMKASRKAGLLDGWSGRGFKFAPLTQW